MAVVPLQPNRVQSTAPAPAYQSADVPAAAFGSLQAQGTINAGRSIGQAADELSRIAAQAAQEANTRAAKQGDAQLSDRIRGVLYGDGTAQNPGFLSRQSDDAIGGAADAQAAIRQAQADVLTSLPQRAQQLAGSVMANRVSTALGQVNAHAAQQRTNANIASSQARIDAATNDAAASWNDPNVLTTSLGVAQSESQAIAQQHGFAPDSDVAAQLTRQAQASLYTNVFKNAVASDPSGNTAAHMLAQYGASIPGDAQAAIQREIERAQKAYQVQQRGILSSQIDDNLASIEATGSPVTPVSNAQISAAYGNEAPRIIERIGLAQHTYNAVQQTALSSPQEDAAMLARMAPAGTGFADQERAQVALQKVIAQKWSAIRNDPAGYVADTAPGMRDMLAAAGSDPSQLAAFAGALDSAYDKLGLPQYNRPLLPKAAASNLVSTILSTPPEQRGGALLGMLNEYGDLKGRVMGDLVASKLPPQYELLAAMPNSADRTLLAGAIGKTKEIRDGLGGGIAKQIDDALSNDPNLADLARSLSYAPGGAAKAGNIAESLKPIAYTLAQQGLDPASAARRAAAAITTSKYDFWEQHGGNVARVPAGQLTTTETAADDLVSALTADHLAAPANPSGVNLTDDQLKQVALKSAQRGYWVTNEADTGLVRVNDAGVPVMLANGKRFELPFAHTHELAGGVAAQHAQQPALGSMPNIGGGATVPQSYTPPSPIAP